MSGPGLQIVLLTTSGKEEPMAIEHEEALVIGVDFGSSSRSARNYSYAVVDAELLGLSGKPPRGEGCAQVEAATWLDREVLV